MDCLAIDLTNTDRKMLCDREDYLRFCIEVGFKAIWLNSYGYAIFSNNAKATLFHRWVFNLPEVEVDHINGNTLDNRKSNLRLANHQQNQQNKATYKNNTTTHRGVSFDFIRQKYRVRITINGKVKHLGRFDTLKEAIEARTVAEKKFDFKGRQI